MTIFLSLAGHLLLSTAFGWTVLNLKRHERTWVETLLLAVLLGIYLETLSAATLMFLGASLELAGLLSALLMSALTVGFFSRALGYSPRAAWERPKWYEWAVLFAVSEKVAFATWQLTRTHTYFDDALTHWSGRARSLFGGINWSFDPSSPYFLGRHIGNGNYPLETVMWRALSATLNGEWNEVLSRADGLVFFLVIVGTIWAAVRRFSNTRGLAAAAAFIVAALPLHAWHAAAGQNDIAVEAFVAVALATILREEWFLGGIMAAGAVWAKNEGLVLYLPSLFIAVLLLPTGRPALRPAWRNAGRFIVGFATCAPWLAFSAFHSLGVASDRDRVVWNPDAPRLLWDVFMAGPTSSIFWIGIFAGTLYSGLAMLKDRVGRALILTFVVTLVAIVAVFAGTTAYDYLRNETTIHRVLMQFSAMALLVAVYGFWLTIRHEQPTIEPVGRQAHDEA